MNYAEKLRWVNFTDIPPSTLEQHKVYTLKKSPYYTLSLSKPGVVCHFPSHFSLEEGVIGKRKEERGTREERSAKREEGGGTELAKG